LIADHAGQSRRAFRFVMEPTSSDAPQPHVARGLRALTELRANPRVRATVLFLYYLGIIIALLLIYGRGDFTTAPFVYQGF
jgi:hypothetical protein